MLWINNHFTSSVCHPNHPSRSAHLQEAAVPQVGNCRGTENGPPSTRNGRLWCSNQPVTSPNLAASCALFIVKRRPKPALENGWSIQNLIGPLIGAPAARYSVKDWQFFPAKSDMGLRQHLQSPWEMVSMLMPYISIWLVNIHHFYHLYGDGSALPNM